MVKSTIVYPDVNVDPQSFPHPDNHCRLTSTDKIEVTQMRKLVLEPKDSRELSADNRGVIRWARRSQQTFLAAFPARVIAPDGQVEDWGGEQRQLSMQGGKSNTGGS